MHVIGGMPPCPLGVVRSARTSDGLCACPGLSSRLLCCRAAVTAKYNRANGYEADCDVIYGDTDSVMVNFKVLNPSRC